MRKILTLSLGIVATLICSNANAAWSAKQSIGGLNSVYTYIPTTKSEIGNGRALMLVLRGCVQEASAFKTANLDKVAEEYGMVIAAADPNTPAGFDCWGYWSGITARTAGDYKNVISMTEALLADTALDIDPNQVYIGGLSSGGAFAMTVGCLAPDIYAGMVLDAAPSIGSGTSIGSPPNTIERTAQLCENAAGSYKSFFQTQITSTAFGTNDYTVGQDYGLHNAKAMSIIYGSTQKSDTTDIQGGSGAVETIWVNNEKPTISMVKLNSVGHAWPGGTGASGKFIDSTNINYGMYIAEFFKQNNKRVTQEEENVAPKLIGMNVYSAEDIIYVKGTADDEDGTISSISIQVSGPENRTETITDINVASHYFDVEFTDLANGDYTVKITAVDDKSAEITSDDFEEVIDIVEEEENVPPTILTFSASTNEAGSCLKVKGTTSDTDGSVTDVVISINGSEEHSATIKQAGDIYQFTYFNCDLAAGNYEVSAKAIDDNRDESNNTDNQSVSIIETEISGPEFSIFEATATEGCINIHAIAEDDEEIIFIQYEIDDFTSPKMINLTEGASQELKVTKCGYASGEYTVRVTTQDNDQVFKYDEQTLLIPEEQDENIAPVITFADYQPNEDGSCIAIAGSASDEDGTIEAISIVIKNTEYPVREFLPAKLVNFASQDWVCGLPAGNYTALINAVDNSSATSESAFELNFTITTDNQDGDDQDGDDQDGDDQDGDDQDGDDQDGDDQDGDDQDGDDQDGDDQNGDDQDGDDGDQGGDDGDQDGDDGDQGGADGDQGGDDGDQGGDDGDQGGYDSDQSGDDGDQGSDDGDQDDECLDENQDGECDTAGQGNGGSDGGSGADDSNGGSGGGGGAPSLILLALGLIALRLRKRS